MRYAETGFNLEIDLARGSIERVANRPKVDGTSSWGIGNQRQDALG